MYVYIYIHSPPLEVSSLLVYNSVVFEQSPAHPRGVHSKPGLGFELLDDVSDTMPHICIYVGHLFVEGLLFEVFLQNRFEMF